MTRFDYLVVGAGLFGATCARDLADAGKRVLVIEKADHVAGMAHTLTRAGQMVQAHGGHIFHTDDRRLWEYVNRFGEWRPYRHRVKAHVRGHVYDLPINLSTLQQVYGVTTGAQARALLAGFVNGHTADNVRDWCLQHIGPDLYAMFVEGYTRKQWGREPAELPAAIIKRLPVRTTWDADYFDDDYQGLPAAGYTALVAAMLAGIRVECGQDYLDRATYWDAQAARVIYTGPIDALAGWVFGPLAYRRLRFEHETHPLEDYQGCPTMNYCDADVPWLRVEEWRHWWMPARELGTTVVTRTYPVPENEWGEPLYPVNDARNQALYDDYARYVAGHKPNLVCGGRLGGYRYLDMHQAIAAARRLVRVELA